MQQQIMQDLERYLNTLSQAERIEALNAFRQLLHDYSPFKSHPVDCVLWVKQESVAPNDYNPNNLAPPENVCCSLRWKRTVLRNPSWCSDKMRRATPSLTDSIVTSWPATKRR